MTWSDACNHLLGVHRGYMAGEDEIDLVFGGSRGDRPVLVTVRRLDHLLNVVARAGGVDPRVARKSVPLYGVTIDFLDWLLVTVAEQAAALRGHADCDSRVD